jgi:methylmalonyl-CoA mutase N-terminal domain/subunit
MGGAVKAIEAGFQAKEIEEAAYRYQMEIESGDQIVVGVNAFTVEEEEFAGELLKVDPELEKSQVQRVQAVRNRRNQTEVEARLRALEDGATGAANLLPLIREAVSAYATLGEVSDSLRKVFGIHKPQ